MDIYIEWCEVRCRSKSGQQKDVRFREISLHAQNMLVRLGESNNRYN